MGGLEELAKQQKRMIDEAIKAYLRAPSGVAVTDPNSGELTTLGSVINEATTLKVSSLNSLTGALTLAVAGGLLSIGSAGSTITITLNAASLSPIDFGAALLPLSNGDADAPSYLFDANGGGIIGEVPL